MKLRAQDNIIIESTRLLPTFYIGLKDITAVITIEFMLYNIMLYCTMSDHVWQQSISP